MEVRDLRFALEEIEKTVALMGTKSAKTDISALLKMLEGTDHQPLELFLKELEEKLKQKPLVRRSAVKAANQEIVAYYSQKLLEAGEDEEKFLKIFAELQNDRKVLKAELAEIAKTYGAPSERTVQKLLQSVRTRFYQKLYDRDAGAMARKATPW